MCPSRWYHWKPHTCHFPWEATSPFLFWDEAKYYLAATLRDLNNIRTATTNICIMGFIGSEKGRLKIKQDGQNSNLYNKTPRKPRD